MNLTANPLRSALLAMSVLMTFVATGLGGPLDGRIDRIIARTDLGGASIAIHAVEVQTGRELIAYRADQPMIPASNMKLITSGVALEVLGPDFAFRTEFRIDDSVTPPTLVVVGSGDPALADPILLEREEVGLSIDKLFDTIAGVIAQSGSRSFGEIVVDDRVFDRTFVHPSWPADQLNRWYCAEVGGLNMVRNVVTVFAEPSQPGGSPITRMVPDAPWISLANRARSDPKGNNTAWVSRPEPNDNMTLFGIVRTRCEIEVAIHNPPTFAGRVIAAELSRRGVDIDQRQVRLARPEERFDGLRTLAVVTTPIADVLERVNTDSHNLYAEALIKRVGHEVSGEPGSWENGAAVTRMIISDKLGAEHAQSTTVSDGSGMSRDNRVQPATLTAWMRTIARDPARWDVFVRSLAVPGKGTLEKRFIDGELSCELAAKSGYLSGIYALSGVLTEPRSGRQVAFSILLNDVPSGARARNAKPFHEAVVEELDAWLAPQPAGANLGG